MCKGGPRQGFHSGREASTKGEQGTEKHGRDLGKAATSPVKLAEEKKALTQQQIGGQTSDLKSISLEPGRTVAVRAGGRPPP